MRIHALGTGDAFNGGGRGHTCFLIEDGQGCALIDAGGQVLQALQRAGVSSGRVDAVHFTHLHGDHLAGWPSLLLEARYLQRRSRPLLVSGPVGTRERLAALWAACYADTASKPLGFALEVVELAPGDDRVLAGRRIEAFQARHMRPPHVALSLRISAARTAAFTGDTGPHEGLLALADGAHVVVGECTDLAAPGPGAQELAAAAGLPGGDGRRHLAWDDWRSLLPRLPRVPLRLAHLSAEARAGAAQIEREGRGLGDVRVLDDGDVIEV